MRYRFGEFELDTAQVELRSGGQRCALEPQVYAVLELLITHRDRLVSKEELIEKVWAGRCVSDSALSSRVKSARQALGDDGSAQRAIRTLHGRGFRFVAEVEASPSELGAGAAPLTALEHRADLRCSATQPSIAVLAFEWLGDAGAYQSLAQALPHELISELTRLRWLFVTAPNSSLRLRASTHPPRALGSLLGVRYALSATLELSGRRLTVAANVVDTRDGGVVWMDRFSRALDDIHAMREALCAGVLAALEVRIPLHEAARAQRAPSEALDAWAAYHLGLQEVYRFTREGNAAATALFAKSLALEPTCARAHAGLSFVHFQRAFLRQTDDVPGEVSLARRFAEQGVALDPLDPFVNFTMGRTFWLEGDLATSLVWLERSTQLSPHYAHGIYARAWAEALSGRGREGGAHVELAMRLSPIDPLSYAMLGTRAFAHLVDGEHDAAAACAERAARSPGAHVLISMLATAAHALNGDGQRASAWAANVRSRHTGLVRADFFRAFPLQPKALRSRVSRALAGLGF